MQKVRVFTESDVKTVSDIFADIPDGWSEKALSESLDNESIKSFVLEDENDVIAFASYLVADDAELVFIVTDKTKLRKGYGKYLLGETLDILNLPCVLEVRESNIPAIKLYEKMGFAVLGKRKKFYSFPEDDAVVMGLQR